MGTLAHTCSVNQGTHFTEVDRRHLPAKEAYQTENKKGNIFKGIFSSEACILSAGKQGAAGTQLFLCGRLCPKQ